MTNIIFNSGLMGLLIWVLLFAVSTAALAIAIRCAWLLRSRLFFNSKLQGELTPLLTQGNWQRAFELCENAFSLAGRIFKAILLVAHEKSLAERQEIVGSMIDRQVKATLRSINTLAMCGNIAPMLGLLGTVTGMVDAFMGLGTALGPEKASILAISISQALYTTAAGLLVAVPPFRSTVIFRNLLEKRIETVTDTLDHSLPLIPVPDPHLVYSNTVTTKLPHG
ncbi:MAG: MotA/TolQ/ExbB proton channel family protein [Victivallales bacterium]|nr:MotA/TolQ/ExbB proton channel family protein [Victivallales bacterium]